MLAISFIWSLGKWLDDHEKLETSEKCISKAIINGLTTIKRLDAHID
jgi:hypothetical protein